jgi:hypothetical protein
MFLIELLEFLDLLDRVLSGEVPTEGELFTFLLDVDILIVYFLLESLNFLLLLEDPDLKLYFLRKFLEFDLLLFEDFTFLLDFLQLLEDLH